MLELFKIQLNDLLNEQFLIYILYDYYNVKFAVFNATSNSNIDIYHGYEINDTIKIVKQTYNEIKTHKDLIYYVQLNCFKPAPTKSIAVIDMKTSVISVKEKIQKIYHIDDDVMHYKEYTNLYPSMINLKTNEVTHLGGCDFEYVLPYKNITIMIKQNQIIGYDYATGLVTFAYRDATMRDIKTVKIWNDILLIHNVYHPDDFGGDYIDDLIIYELLKQRKTATLQNINCFAICDDCLITASNKTITKYNSDFEPVFKKEMTFTPRIIRYESGEYIIQSYNKIIYILDSKFDITITLNDIEGELLC